MAAIFWNPEAYDTSGTMLMGRHSAGEGFIRGYLRHSTGETVTLFNTVSTPPIELEPLVRRLGPTDKPIQWLSRGDMPGLARAGVLNLPVPGLSQYAWGRRSGGARQFSICGVTHTTITPRVLDMLLENRTAPTEPWDALVCTSRAVKASVEAQWKMFDAYMNERFGAAKYPKHELPVIPLGIVTDDFAHDPKARAGWRGRLKIEDDAVAVLYVGRFNWSSKMNPVVMALALERAAAQTGKAVHWILAGWADEQREKEFKDAVAAHTNKVKVHWVDGRPPENRRSIWSSADIFISLSENMQETYGLTPVEAMAAGLPSVITDWNGYRDTIRHGVDGFRIATTTPAAGLGRDLAFQVGQEWIGYDVFVGSIAQLTAVDLDAAARSLLELIENPDLRKRFGQNAQARARAAFDWGKIIPQYEMLWSELNARRKAAPPEESRTRNTADSPWRPDPFRMYAGYPTQWLTMSSMLTREPGMDWAAAQVLMSKLLVRSLSNYLPTPEEVRVILEVLIATAQIEVGALLSRFPSPRRPFLERGIIWMAKYGMVRIMGFSNHMSN